MLDQWKRKIEREKARAIACKEDLAAKESVYNAAKTHLADSIAEKYQLGEREKELKRMQEEIPELARDYETAKTTLEGQQSQLRESEGRLDQAKSSCKKATLKQSEISNSLTSEEDLKAPKQARLDALLIDHQFLAKKTQIKNLDRQIRSLRNLFGQAADRWIDEVRSLTGCQKVEQLRTDIPQAEEQLREARRQLSDLRSGNTDTQVGPGVLADYLSSQGATALSEFLGGMGVFCVDSARLVLTEVMMRMEAPVVFVEGKIELPGKQVMNVVQNVEAGSVTSSDASDTPSEAGSDASTPLEVSEAAVTSTPLAVASTPSDQESAPSESEAAVANSSTDSGMAHVSLFI